MKTNNHNISEAKSERSNADASTFFESQGYYLAENLISKEQCISLVQAFNTEVKPFEGELLRVTTAEAEKHYLSDQGLMVNPIMDIQDLDIHQFPGFHQCTIDVLANQELQSLSSSLLNDSPVLIQSGYFESSLGSVPHIDSYFFDSEDKSLIACWIALENIDDNAGRFSIYPQSHKLGTPGIFDDRIRQMFRDYELKALEIVQCSQIDKKAPDLSKVKECRKLLDDIIDASELKPLTPDLNAGDVVFFSSKTIHGSDIPASTSSSLSRNSLIGHFAPLTQKLIRYGKLEEKLNPYLSNGMNIQPCDIR